MRTRDSTNYLKLPKAMKAFVEAWPSVSTFTDYLRASGVFFTCPREFVLNYWQPRANRWFDFKSQLMMNTGSHLHELVQNTMLGPMGVLRGIWQDTSVRDRATGQHPKVEGYHPDPMKSIHEISNQQPLTWRYEEYKVWDEQYRTAGHLDGIVSVERIIWLSENMKLVKADPGQAFKELQSIGHGDEACFEFKTTGSYLFDKIKTAHDIAPYYKMQAVVYQKLSQRYNTVFWYMNRDSMASNIMLYPYEQGWWTQLTNKARIIWEAIRDETLPDTFMACNTPQDKRAKECTFATECWMRNLDFPKYVAEGKIRAAKEGRKLLDLSSKTWPAVVT